MNHLYINPNRTYTGWNTILPIMEARGDKWPGDAPMKEEAVI